MANVLIASSLITNLKNVIVTKHVDIVTKNIISQFANALLVAVNLLLLVQHNVVLVLLSKLTTLVLVQPSRIWWSTSELSIPDYDNQHL